MRIVIDDNQVVSCKVSDFIGSDGKYYRSRNPILLRNLSRKDKDSVRILIDNILHNLL